LKYLASLLLVCLSSIAQAAPSASFWMSYDAAISGWNPVDEDNDPDNGPHYPDAYAFGFGGYVVNYTRPGGGLVMGYRDEEGGMPYFGPDVPYSHAGITIGGGATYGYLTFESGSVGSARVSGVGQNVFTVLPGVTVTLNGYLSNSWNLEADNAFTYSIGLVTYDFNARNIEYAPLFGRSGFIEGASSDGEYVPFSFSYTNTSDAEVMRGFNISAYYDLEGAIAAPVPEPETYAFMLAGLGVFGFTARRRKHRVAQHS
jgi:hypothetical protein